MGGGRDSRDSSVRGFSRPLIFPRSSSLQRSVRGYGAKIKKVGTWLAASIECSRSRFWVDHVVRSVQFSDDKSSAKEITILSELGASNTQQVVNFGVPYLAQKKLKLLFRLFNFACVPTICANFNKFGKYLKQLWPKTHYRKNDKITILQKRLGVHQNFEHRF